MGRPKIYICCICHEVLEEYKPTRLVRQEYGRCGYRQYGPVHNYDFCEKCYRKFDNWVRKHEEKNMESSVGSADKSGVRTD